MSGSEKTKARTKYLAAAAAVLLLILFGTGIYYFNVVLKSEAASIFLEVNPAVEIKINKKDRVLEAAALNDEGREILEETKLKGKDIDEALKAVLGSMLTRGFLDDSANSILISVDSKDAEKAAQIQAKISAEIKEILKAKNISGAVLTQNISKRDKAIEAFAAKHKISVGKAGYILNFVSANPNFDAEELGELSINELNVLRQNGKAPDKVKSSGKASEKAYIGFEAAKKIALRVIGAAETDIVESDIDFEVEMIEGKAVIIYEAELERENIEYEIKIDAVTGKVLYNSDAGKDFGKDFGKEIRKQSGKGKAKVGGSENEVPKSADYIGRDRAVSAALENAGLSASAVHSLQCELQRDEGRTIYDVEFHYDGFEYEYEIDALTGRIIEFDKDLI